MDIVKSENVSCLCNFIIEQQKYIENINMNKALDDSVIEDKENKKENQNSVDIKLKSLCDIVNIEYETMLIKNVISHNLVYHNGKKIKITDNLNDFGWLIIVNNSHILNHYIKSGVEWCFIYHNVVELAKEYNNIYFTLFGKGFTHNMSLAIYYATITTINLNILINDELYSFIRQLVSLFTEDEKKIAISEISNFIKIYRTQK